MEKQKMDSFYYDLVNINSNYESRLEDIKLCVEQIRYNYNNLSETEGLCKVISLEVSASLKEDDVSHRIINTKDFGSDYEHNFVIAFYKTDEVHYVLIDLTFHQFLPEEGRVLLPNFKKWPAEVLLMDTKGKDVLESLLNFGYAPINNEIFNKYLACFTNKDTTFNINDIIAIDFANDESFGIN